jgi:hypothetical protein
MRHGPFRLAAAAAAALLAALAAVPAAAVPSSAPAQAASAPVIPAKIGLTPAFAALEEGMDCAGARRGTLYLTVENEGKSDLVVTSARLLAPSDLELCSGAELPATVAAGRQHVIAVPVGTSRAMRPGTAPLLIEVRLRAMIEGTLLEDLRLAHDEVELRIPGLSDILKLVGMPTLFLLPGALVLGAFFLVFPVESPRLAPNSLGFWIVAISLSLALSAVYYLATSLLGEARNLTQRFGLTDVAWVWAGSVSLGAIAGRYARWQRDQARSKAEKREKQELADRTLTREDDPVTVLNKLERLGTAWPLGWYRTDDGAGFLVEPPAGPAWLIPQAEAKPRPSEVPVASWDSARRALDALMRSSPSRAALIEALRAGPIALLAPLQWQGEACPEPLGEKDEPHRAGDRPFVATQ